MAYFAFRIKISLQCSNFAEKKTNGGDLLGVDFTRNNIILTQTEMQFLFPDSRLVYYCHFGEPSACSRKTRVCIASKLN